MLNKVTLIGRLGKDPEVKSLQTGQTVAKFSLATSEKWRDKDGKFQERTEWHNVVVWGKLAEICAQNLTKGRTAFVEGKIQTRSWDDKGSKKYVTEIVAEKVIFMDDQKQSGGDFSAPSNDDPF